MNRRLLIILVTTGLLIGGTAYRRHAVDPKMLPVLIQGCQDAVARVKSGKGTVKVHRVSYEEGRPSAESEGTYIVAFDTPRYKIAGDTHTAGDIEPFILSWDGRHIPDLATAWQASRTLTASEALITQPDGNGHGIRRIDLNPFGKDATDKGLRIARREWLQGHECIVVVRTGESSVGGKKLYGGQEYWVDPKRGFAVLRVRDWAYGGPLRRRTTICEANAKVRDYGNGIWGPAKYTFFQSEYDGKGGMRVTRRYETTYQPDFRLNVPVTESDLTP